LATWYLPRALAMTPGLGLVIDAIIGSRGIVCQAPEREPDRQGEGHSPRMTQIQNLSISATVST